LGYVQNDPNRSGKTSFFFFLVVFDVVEAAEGDENIWDGDRQSEDAYRRGSNTSKYMTPLPLSNEKRVCGP
jgi:hypothetical protein